MIKHPVYTAGIVSSRCSVELSINGIPVFNSFESGTMSVDWPVNFFIVENPVQSYELKIMPLKEEAVIVEKAIAKIKFVVREAIEEYVQQEEITEEIEVHFSDKKNLPFYIIKGVFNAKLPYKITAFKNTVDLSKENQEKLFEEIIQWNKKLSKIYVNSEIQEYLKVFKIRNEELFKSLYLNQQEISEEEKSIFHPKDKFIVPLPDNLYKLELFANGKIASVRLPYELPGFRYDPNEPGEDAMGFSLNVYFQRREKGLPLEIIK